MTLRCRPGDLAIYVGADAVAVGRPCTVLLAAPVGRKFRLPDGRRHRSTVAGHWIVEFPRAIAMPLRSGNRIPSRLGVAPDSSLRPIRPEADPIDVPVDADEPVGVAG